MKPDNERIQKLPVWARDLITSLERERDSAQKRLSEFRDNTTPSGVYIKEYDVRSGSPDYVKTFIQDDQVHFDIDSKTTVCVRLCKGYLRVSTLGLKSRISVEPEASNVVRIVGVE